MAWRDGVIPVAVKRVRHDPQSREHLIEDLDLPHPFSANHQVRP